MQRIDLPGPHGKHALAIRFGPISLTCVAVGLCALKRFQNAHGLLVGVATSGCMFNLLACRVCLKSGHHRFLFF
jgi:hypothetical protein